MIETISGFLSTIVELLQGGINGLVNAIAAIFNGAEAGDA